MRRSDRTIGKSLGGRRTVLVVLALLVLVGGVGVVIWSGGGPPSADNGGSVPRTESASTEAPVPDSAIAVDSCSALGDIDDDLSATYVLTRDLNCAASRTWNGGDGLLPIGGNGAQPAFSGTFDGRGHTIANLHIHNRSANYVGLFGRIGVDDAMDPAYPRSGCVTDLHLANVSISGSRLAATGGIAGDLARGTITNVTVSGTITNRGNTGGIAATIQTNATVRHALSRVTIVNDGVGIVGGIAGRNDGGTIRTSGATGRLVGSNHVHLGGVAGSQANGSVLSDSYSTATIETTGPDSIAGGLVARSWPPATVTNCYAAGNVSGDTIVGGLIAAGAADCRGCFWDVTATGVTRSVVGTGLDTTAMHQRGTFSSAGWDFEDTWAMDGYPRLQWSQGETDPLTVRTRTAASPVTLDASDTGSTLQVEPGRTVEIELASNPSTGYEWNYTDPRPVARVLADRFVRTETPGLGSPGLRLVRLEVRESGTFRMVYRRPWSDELPERVFIVHFTVVGGH